MLQKPTPLLFVLTANYLPTLPKSICHRLSSLHQSLRSCYRSADDKAHAIPGTKYVWYATNAERLISRKHPGLCPASPRPCGCVEMLHLLFMTSERVGGYGARYSFLVLLGVVSQGKAVL